MRRFHRRREVLMLSVAMAGSADLAAHAQSKPPAQATAPTTEIIVTAQKRAQSINTVGMSITAVPGAQLRQLGVKTVAHLARAKAEAAWGVGRHLLGSQVFDYWKDPWGHEVEHWTDGDQLRAADGSRIASIPELTGVQWGMPIPPHPGLPAAEA